MNALLILFTYKYRYNELLFTSYYINILIFLINILPLYPLDGYQIYKLLLLNFFEETYIFDLLMYLSIILLIFIIIFMYILKMYYIILVLVFLIVRLFYIRKNIHSQIRLKTFSNFFIK